MFYYVAFYLWSTFLVIIGNSKEQTVRFLALSAFAFSAVRFNAGADYFSYVDIIKHQWITGFEPLSKVLAMAAGYTSPQLFFTLASLITLCFYCKTYLYVEQQVALSALGFIAFIFFPVGYLESFNVVRQFIAISLFLYAFSIVDKSLVRSVCILIIAALFHKIAMLYLPVILLYQFFERQRPIALYILLVLISFLGGRALVAIMSNYAGVYKPYFTTLITPYGYKSFVAFLLLFSYFLIFRFNVFQHALTSRLFNLYFLGLCIYAATIPYGVHLARVAWLPIAVYPFLVGCVLEGKSQLHKIAFFLSASMLFFTLLYLASVDPAQDRLTQYQVYFMMTEEERNTIEANFLRHLDD